MSWQVATDRVETFILNNDTFKDAATNIILNAPDQQTAADEIKQAFINQATNKIQTIVTDLEGNTVSTSTVAWIQNVIIQDYLTQGVDWLFLVNKYWTTIRGA